MSLTYNTGELGSTCRSNEQINTTWHCLEMSISKNAKQECGLFVTKVCTKQGENLNPGFL